MDGTGLGDVEAGRKGVPISELERTGGSGDRSFKYLRCAATRGREQVKEELEAVAVR